jgi:hypothetical protein
MTAAMAQYLAIDDGPEDDRTKAAAALPDAIAGARTPVVRTDCCRTSIKECSRTWGCYEQRYRLTGLIGRPLAAGLALPAVGIFSSCRSPSNQTSAPSAGSEEVAAIKTTPVRSNAKTQRRARDAPAVPDYGVKLCEQCGNYCVSARAPCRAS